MCIVRLAPYHLKKDLHFHVNRAHIRVDAQKTNQRIERRGRAALHYLRAFVWTWDFHYPMCVLQDDY
jgi:hypothetical protein